MITRPHVHLELLESRRLLSAEAPLRTAPAQVEDQPVGHTGGEDVVVAPGRSPIYPPLAPAMWMDETIGSFELPEAIAFSTFPPDEPAAQEPAGEAESLTGELTPPPIPQTAVTRFDASTQPAKSASITTELFDSDEPSDLAL